MISCKNPRVFYKNGADTARPGFLHIFHLPVNQARVRQQVLRALIGCEFSSFHIHGGPNYFYQHLKFCSVNNMLKLSVIWIRFGKYLLGILKLPYSGEIPRPRHYLPAILPAMEQAIPCTICPLCLAIHLSSTTADRGIF